MDLNIRDFPDELNRQLKSEAALKGKSLRKLVIEYLQCCNLMVEFNNKETNNG